MKKLLLFGALVLVSLHAQSQTAPYAINQNHNGCCGGGATSGSSFLTFGAGQIDSIKVYNRSSQDYLSGNTISVFQGNTTSAGSLLHSEDAGAVHASFTQSEVMIRFASPVHVSAASTYTFYIEGFPTRYSGSNDYADGTYWSNLTEDTGEDLDFILYIGQITATGIDPATNGSENRLLYKSIDKVLEASASVPAGYELSLYDNNGNLLITVVGNKLNVSSFPQGLYVARLKTGNVIYTSKIVVQ